MQPGVFDENKYWDVEFEYAKNTSQDVLCKLTVHNRGPEEAILHVLPTLWFRNTWIWGCKHEGCTTKPRISLDPTNPRKVKTKHDTLEEFHCEWEAVEETDASPLLFTENETNTELLFNTEQYTSYVKDAFHRYVVNGEKEAVSPKGRGTKVAALHVLRVPAGKSRVIRVRLYKYEDKPAKKTAFEDFEDIFTLRKKEADEFYSYVSLVHPCIVIIFSFTKINYSLIL